MDETDFQPPHAIDLDALSMSTSNSHFLDEDLVEPARQSTLLYDVFSSLSAAGGSSSRSIHSSGAGASSPDDILSVLQMVVAHLGLDKLPAQPIQTCM